jgi:hypothetical protein
LIPALTDIVSLSTAASITLSVVTLQAASSASTHLHKEIGNTKKIKKSLLENIGF